VHICCTLERNGRAFNRNETSPRKSGRKTEASTILELIEQAERLLHRTGVESPRLDAEMLLAHVLSCERVDLYLHGEETPDERHVRAFRQLVGMRALRCPCKYLIGECEFMSLEFRVSPAAIIPRPETEILTAKAIEILKDMESAVVADIGTGCGNIAVAIAMNCPNVTVYACDKSPKALRLARENIKLHGLEGRVLLRHGDLFDALADDGLRNRLDMVVCNPPYIPTDELRRLEPEVSFFEPWDGLNGGEDGLDFVRRIVPESVHYLSKGGHLLLEVGHDQARAVKELVDGVSHLRFVQFIRDYSGKERCVLSRREK